MRNAEIQRRITFNLPRAFISRHERIRRIVIRPFRRQSPCSRPCRDDARLDDPEATDYSCPALPSSALIKSYTHTSGVSKVCHSPTSRGRRPVLPGGGGRSTRRGIFFFMRRTRTKRYPSYASVCIRINVRIFFFNARQTRARSVIYYRYAVPRLTIPARSSLASIAFGTVLGGGGERLQRKPVYDMCAVRRH